VNDYLAHPSSATTFQASHVRNVDKRFLGDCANVTEHDKIPEAIGRTIGPKIDAFVFDNTSCDLKEDGYEAYSMHAIVEEQHRMLDITRMREDGTPIDCVTELLDTMTLLRQLPALASSEIPVLSAQAGVMTWPIRRRLAAVGMSYAMRVEPHVHFDLDQHLDHADDAPDGYSVEHAFAVLRRKRGGRDTAALQIRDMPVEPSSPTRLVEYVVEIPANGRSSYFLVRTAPSPPTARRHGYLASAISLAQQAADLPSCPLANTYRAHEFHHRNRVPWKNVLMVVALGVAANFPIA
jgi:hypothetical protein